MSDVARFLTHPWIDAVLRCRPLWALGALAWMGFLFWTSHRTWEDETSSLPSGTGNVLHFLLYGFLGGLWTLALGGWTDRSAVSPRSVFVGAVVASTAFGVIDEIHQHFVVGRTCSIFDAVVDAHGAAFAALSLAALRGCGPRGRRLLWLLTGLLVSAMVFALVVPALLPAWDDI